MQWSWCVVERGAKHCLAAKCQHRQMKWSAQVKERDVAPRRVGANLQSRILEQDGRVVLQHWPSWPEARHEAHIRAIKALRVWAERFRGPILVLQCYKLILQRLDLHVQLALPVGCLRPQLLCQSSFSRLCLGLELPSHLSQFLRCFLSHLIG